MNDSIEKITGNFSDVCKQYENILSQINTTDKKIDHRIKVCDDTDAILAEAESQFEELTSIINKKDITFFVFSVILQYSAKYLIKVMREMSDRELAKRTPFHSEEHSGRSNLDYYATKEEIISNPVPFDAIQKAHDTKWYKVSAIPTLVKRQL